MNTVDLLIIGGGPAGLSAALRAREEGLENILLVERNGALGGILNQCIHHGFGLHVFKEELTGPEYAGRLIEQVRKLGIPCVTNAMVTAITDNTGNTGNTDITGNTGNTEPLTHSSDKTKTVTFVSSRGIVQVNAKAVILAMGCRERARGALGIPGERGAGVYTAGTAQAFVNMKGHMPGKNAVILGSGDIGLIMARRLTLEGARVSGVYELMPYSGGLKRNIAQCLNDYGIPLYLSHTVTRIVGHERVEGVYVAAVDENRRPLPETEHFVPCDTLLLSVGLIPENELAKQIGVALSPITGGAVVNDRLETSIPGVFACGNALHVHDLADNVTLEAYDAAVNAVRYIRGDYTDSEAIPVVAGPGVRYTVPSTLTRRTDNESNPVYDILFRSDDVYKKARVNVYADEEILKSTPKRIVTPGEMERVRFTLSEQAWERVNEVRVVVTQS